MQAKALGRARGLAALLQVWAEDLRSQVTAAAAQYRRLFTWLLQVRRFRLHHGITNMAAGRDSAGCFTAMQLDSRATGPCSGWRLPTC